MIKISASARRICSRFLLCAALLPGFHSQNLSAESKKSSKAILIFDPSRPSVSDWKTSWGSLPSGAAVKVDGGKMLITGNLASQSYGCVYRSLEVDIDKTPYLEMEVESASHHWYLLLKGEQLPNGYVKVQPDTDQMGLMQFDLRLAAGLSGKQVFSEVQLGVSTEESASGNKGQTLLIRKIQLSPAEEMMGGPLELYGPKNRGLSGWKNTNDDRSPTGVDMVPSTGAVTLRGNRSSHSYGMMYRSVNVDTDRYHVLKFDVESVTHHWYLILIHPELNKGFVRVQPDSSLTGAFYYDLKDITGLSGIKNMRLQAGVSTNEEDPSCLGEKLTIKEIALISPSQVPSSGKILKKKDIKFSQKIQAVPPRVSKILEDPLPLRVKPAGISIEKAGGGPAPAPRPKILTEIGKEFDKIFSQGHPYRNPGNDAAPSPVSFTEKKDALIVQNAFYKLSLSRENGSILSLYQAGSSLPVITGNLEGSLWKADTLDRKVIESKSFRPGSSDKNFSWKWNKETGELLLEYNDKPLPLKMRVVIRFDRSSVFEIGSEITNLSDKTILTLLLPHGLLFPSSSLDRVILPRLIGVAFKPGFFSSQKQWSDPYPSAFSDFAWIGARSGAVSVYMVTPKDSFQPATMELGGSASGTEGFYTHRLPVHVVKNKIWKSPRIRVAVGGAAHETLQLYSKETGVADFPSLKERLRGGLYGKLIRSPFVKVDQSANVDIPSVLKFLKDIPVPSILHLSSFWPGGFDKNYPDYLPPDAEYGTMDDFKALAAQARQRGLLVMPYSNPTWWNEGPTLKRLLAEKIGVKVLDGALLREKYNENPGVVINPFDPKVIERNGQTVKEFTETVPMDFLFHDQIGARRWIYMGGAADPLSFTQGLINQVSLESVKIPLMTEGGFDRLIPYEAGFCGMTSLSYPGFSEYDRLWGKGNWEIYPISALLAHDKVLFYQHNLSDDILSDTDAKVSWNLAYGFGLTVARTYIRQNLEKKWLELAGILHREVMPGILGEKMNGFLRLSDRATWSRFGDVDVFVNHSAGEPLEMGPHAVAPSGFLLQSRTADENGDIVTAGLMTRLNGRDLDSRHYFILKSNDRRIEIIQPDAKTTLVSVERPSSWTKESGIRAYQVKDGAEIEIPAAVEDGLITILYQADKGLNSCRVRYEPAAEPVELSLLVKKTATDASGVMTAEVRVSNGGDNSLSGLQVYFSAWRVGSHDRLPARGPAVQEWTQKTGESVNPGSAALARFVFDMPASNLVDGKLIWVSARLTGKWGGKSVSRTVSRPVDFDSAFRGPFR